MALYPLTDTMSAFVAKTLGFNSTDSSLAGLRQAYSEMCRAFTPPRPAGLEVTDFTLSGVAVRSYRPPVTPAASGWPCLLYLHGGGWVVGNLDSHDFICAELAATLGAVVVAVDYRLAPEHPFPSGFEDCLKVWRALRSGPFWFDPEKMIVAGDSAGGNLAAALCLALRDAGEPLPMAQVLIYPGLGGDQRLPSREECADAPLLSSSDLACYQALYLRGSEKLTAYAMPLLATDFSGLPPALIAVAQFDPLRDDGVVYAERLNAAGVAATLYCGPGLVHGCLRARGQVPEVDRLYETLLVYMADKL
ncbi:MULTISPECIES: alpha/beta hydrolase [unclassified Pseudomonas]|uniref:alpha/beta hydrolase n=1 Tax=unclassified Pseudomonas TaxID=196821 RepID=UPI002AC8C6EE|nr:MULTISPECIES: alpha/beta hydrolase [unclassified Pseudomonas]MEB0044754.1 alpha/beta hydrolase [Pseudomonas sp. Dout3]MEB0096279.1 alpha/beta hydrolase [Pseudomonas sp. DC1.2]WPX59320.1 alpha/beta hydrolase [Pseudomonas sp. DC1.2]